MSTALTPASPSAVAGRPPDAVERLSPEMVASLASVIRDPVQYAQGILGHKVWDTPRQIMTALAHSRKHRVAVKACHASSKTFTAAELVLWWITAHTNGIVVTTAPTWLQVKRILWAEIADMVAHSRIALPEPNVTSLKISDKRYAIGLSTRDGVKFHGFHGKVLVIFDEAPGILNPIFEAVEGIAAGGDVRRLYLGNPLINSGAFYDCFGIERAQYDCFTISAFNTPNLRGLDESSILELSEDELDINPWPFLVTRRWVRDRLRVWGHRHPMYQARVLGEFPDQPPDAVFSIAWMGWAEPPWDEDADADGPIPASQLVQVGVDVAGPGEAETVIYWRRGPAVLGMNAYLDPDPRGLLIADLTLIRDNETRNGRQMGPVVVDSNGIGYYLALHLVDAGFDVRFANAGAGAMDSARFVNQRAEMVWGLREHMERRGVRGLADDLTQGQLCGIRWKITPGGRIQIESKDDAKKRGVPSPDRAEGLMLAFATVPPPAAEGVHEEYEPVRISPY